MAGGYCSFPVPRWLMWALVVDVGAGGVDRLDGVDDEVDEVPGWNPVAQVRRKKHRGVAVDSNKSCHINLHSKN